MGLFQRRKTDTDEQIVLVSLLRKPRPVELQAAVQEVYLSDLSDQAKIARIRVIDNTDSAAEYGRQVPPAAPRTAKPVRYFGSNPPEKHSPPPQSTSTESSTPRQERLYVPAPPLKRVGRSGFFRFLFHELGTLLKHGASNPALRIRFFPPRVDVDSEAVMHWITRIQPVASELEYLISGAELSSWKYLDKLEYNTLRVFSLLLREIVSADPGNHLDTPEKLYRDLETIEELLLVIHGNDLTVDALLSSIRAVKDHRDGRVSSLEDPVRLAEELISRQTDEFSVWGILTALHCALSRMYITLDDLVTSSPGLLVPDTRFVCPAEVMDEIERYLSGREEYAARLEKEYMQIMRIRSFVRTTDSGKPDFKPMKILLDRRNVELDELDPLRLIPDFVEHFVRMYRELLDGTVCLEHLGELRLFPPPAFDPLFARFELVAQRITSLRLRAGSISHTHLIDVMHGRREATEPESEASHQLSIALDAARQIQRSVTAIIRNSRLVRSVDSPGSWVPRTPEHYASGSAEFPLDHLLESPPHLAGRTVGDRFHTMLRVLYLFRYHFRERSLLHTLDREHRILHEMLEVKREILRLATSSEATEIFRRVRMLGNLTDDR
ncbi:MAG: hypothetical protein ACOC4I_04480 [Spirochaetota bacterium]